MQKGQKLDINSKHFIRSFLNSNHSNYKKETNNNSKPINYKISNSEIANAIQKPNSHSISKQKESDFQKHSFSVTRFLSNNQRTVKLIAGIGLGTLVLGLIYPSSRTTFAPSSSGNPVSASSSSTPDNAFIKNPSLKREALLENPSRLENLSQSNLQCFPSNFAFHENSNPSPQILILNPNTDQKRIEAQFAYSFELISNLMPKEVATTEINLGIPYNTANSINDFIEYVYESSCESIEYVDEYMRTSLGIPKWIWETILSPQILEPLQSLITYLPLLGINLILTPVLTLSRNRAINFMKGVYPKLRLYVPKILELRNNLDGRFIGLITTRTSSDIGINPRVMSSKIIKDKTENLPDNPTMRSWIF